MSVSPPASFSHLLGQPLDGVARVTLRHERRSEFRWFGLLELAMGLCLLPCVVLILLLGDDSASSAEGQSTDVFDRLLARLYDRHHDVVLSLWGPDGRQIAEARHTPSAEAEGDAVLGSVLATAAAQGVVVIETIAPTEVAEVWYGGRPLLSRPEAMDLGQLERRLQQAGATVTVEDDRVELALPRRAGSRGGAILGLVIVAPFAPLMIFSTKSRRLLADLWGTARGAPTQTTVEVRAETLEVVRRRGQEVVDRIVFDIVDVLGIGWSPSLGYDANVSRRGPRLRLITRHGARTVPVAFGEGAVLRDVLVGSILWLRRRRTDLPGLVADATRCPYCSTLYRLEPDVRCPSCGAWAGAVA